MVKIRVNGVEKTLQKEGQPLTYAGALVLAGFDPDLTLTVTWATQQQESSVPEDLKTMAKKYPGAVMMQSFCFKLSEPIRRKRGRHQEDTADYIYLYAEPIRFGATSKSPEIEVFQKEAVTAFTFVLEAEWERYAMLRRLEEIVKACATDTALRELLPEMAHLIPAPPEKAFPLVATQANNLVAELVKAGLELKEAA